MNKIIATAALVTGVLLCGCNTSKVKISGRLLGLNGRSVYLERVSGGFEKIVDSVALDDDGGYRFTIENAAATPSLYNIYYNGERIPLLVSGGERITVNSVGSLLRNYTVTGSEESELLREFNRIYVDGMERMNAILDRFPADDDEAGREAVMKEYMAEYRAVKREQLRFIIEHKDRIAAVYALYQRFPGEKNLFSPDGDIIYYRTVADAVEERYPESTFLPMLRSEITRMDARMTMMSQISEADYPDIALPDMYGKEVRLSSLAGKVILLSFWSAGAGSSNVLNAELKDIYEKYAERGFEIYQVGVDMPRALWINTVQEQQLPWVSVCDLRGGRAASLSLYNVQALPADFLIDRDGNIVGKNLYGEELDRTLSQLLP